MAFRGLLLRGRSAASNAASCSTSYERGGADAARGMKDRVGRHATRSKQAARRAGLSLTRRGRCCESQRVAVASASVDGGQASCYGEKNGKRVVVTGMGVVSSLGLDPQEMYANMLEGRSGVSPIEKFDASDLPTRFAGEVRRSDIHMYVECVSPHSTQFCAQMSVYMKFLTRTGCNDCLAHRLRLGGGVTASVSIR